MNPVSRWTWLPVAGLTITSLAVIGLLGHVVHLSWIQFEQRQIDSNTALVRIVASHVGLALRGIEGDLRGVQALTASDPTLLEPGDPRLAAMLRRAASANPAIGAFNVFNRDATLVASSLPISPPGVPPHSDESFALHQRDPVAGAVISMPLNAVQLGTPAFSISLGIRSADGDFVGKVGAILPRARLLEVFNAMRMSGAARLSLLHRDGRYLAQLPAGNGDPPASVPAERAGSTWARLAGADVFTQTVESPHDGVTMQAAYRRIDGFPIFVVASLPVDSILAEWWQAEKWRKGAYLLFAVLLVGLNVFVFRRAQRAAGEEAVHAAALKRSEAALAASEIRFAAALDSISDGFALWSREGLLLEWNRRYLELFPMLTAHVRAGAPAQDIARAFAQGAMPRQIDGDVFASITRPGNDASPTAHRSVLRLASGVVVEASRLRLNDGGVLSIYRDISAADRAAAALRESEALLRDAIESLGEGVTIWDADDRLMLWNRRYLAISPHLEPLLRVGAPFAEIYDAALRAAAPDLDVEAFAERRRFRLAGRGKSEQATFFDGPNGQVLEIVECRTQAGGLVGVYRDVTRERAVLARHALSEARFRDGIDSMDDAFALYDADDRLVTWNGRYAELMPYVAGKLRMGRRFPEFLEDVLRGGMPDLDAGQREEWVRQRLATRALGEPVEFETPARLILRAVDRKTSEGGYVTVVQDVTEHRRLLLRISESEALLRDAMTSMADEVVIFDSQTRLVTWNSAYEARMATPQFLRPGITLADMFLGRLALSQPGLSSEERATLLAERMEHWHHPRVSRAVAMPDGRRMEVSERRTANGGMVVVYRDVTEQARAATRLAESERRFRDFAETASDWFWETDAEHRITFTSIDRARHGVGAGTPIGKRRSELSLANDGAVSPEVIDLEARMDRREAYRGFVYPVLDPSAGELRMIELAGKPIFGADGGFLGYRGTGSDVTERIRQQDALARALAAERDVNMQQRRFVSIASHEFRTPLAIIDGASQRIAAKLRDGMPEVTKRLDRIRSAVSRMTEMIERTLSSARLDEGRITLEVRQFDLGALLRETCNRQRQISPGHEVALAPLAEELVVEGDPKLLEQVMTNLLSNAVKYSGIERRVEVFATEHGPWVEIAVRDHGIGIPAGELPDLFTRFFRASTADGIPGTGIGLHLTRELVALHGGSVDVASQLGQGSTFVVRLPRRQPLGARPEAAE